MKKYQNMGQIDRLIRFIVGTVSIIMLFYFESNWRYVGLLGFILIFTSALGICPLYMPFKIDTRKKT